MSSRVRYALQEPGNMSFGRVAYDRVEIYRQAYIPQAEWPRGVPRWRQLQIVVTAVLERNPHAGIALMLYREKKGARKTEYQNWKAEYGHLGRAARRRVLGMDEPPQPYRAVRRAVEQVPRPEPEGF